MAFIMQRYDAFLYPNQGKQSGRINLYCEDHKLYILFSDPGDPLPANSFNAATKIGVAYQVFSQYEYFLDMVRNEKPIRVTFRPEDSPPAFVVYCSEEIPGEGEMQSPLNGTNLSHQIGSPVMKRGCQIWQPLFNEIYKH